MDQTLSGPEGPWGNMAGDFQGIKCPIIDFQDALTQMARRYSRGNGLKHRLDRHGYSWFARAFHWQLDVSFRKDAVRNRKDNGPANTAILQRRALKVAQRDASTGSLSIKLKRAGWDGAVLLKLLNLLDRE